MNSSAPEGLTVPDPLITPVMLPLGKDKYFVYFTKLCIVLENKWNDFVIILSFSHKKNKNYIDTFLYIKF
jgi:hypothetical protein